MSLWLARHARPLVAPGCCYGQWDVPADAADTARAAQALADAYAFERRGIRIVRLDKAWQMVSSGEMADFVTKALETRKPPKLSGAQLESLSDRELNDIGLTRADIDAVVNHRA